MKIITYHSSQADPEKGWLAHMELAPNVYMSFFGNTEQAAHNRATAWYEAEKARQARLVGTSEETLASDNPKGKGQVFVGKVWLLNRATGERARVMPTEVPEYLSRGFVKGGPRST